MDDEADRIVSEWEKVARRRQNISLVVHFLLLVFLAILSVFMVFVRLKFGLWTMGLL